MGALWEFTSSIMHLIILVMHLLRKVSEQALNMTCSIHDFAWQKNCCC